MTTTFEVKPLGTQSVAKEDLFTVVQTIDGVAQGGDHHWVRERYAERACSLYRADPSLFGRTSNDLKVVYFDLFGIPMFD